MTRPLLVLLAALGVLASACAAIAPSPEIAAETATAPPERGTDLGPYLDVLAGMAPGNPALQRATLDAALADRQATPTAANRLRYALALGSAVTERSDPAEARRLLTELLAEPNDLTADAQALAYSFAHEFDARINLAAELARQREESDARLASVNASAEQRTEALAAENARLKRALAESDRKLKAVAEMERQLLEQAADPEPPPSPP